MPRTVTVRLEGPHVGKWAREQARGAVAVAAGPYFHRNPRIGPGLYVVEVDVTWSGPADGYVTIRVVGGQGDETAAPDELARDALDAVNRHANALAFHADQLEVRVENA